MKFKAEIDVMPLDALLDPQGKAVSQSMGNIGMDEITNVRIGKHIRLFVDADSKTVAEEKVTAACKKMLVNEIILKRHLTKVIWRFLVFYQTNRSNMIRSHVLKIRFCSKSRQRPYFIFEFTTVNDKIKYNDNAELE